MTAFEPTSGLAIDVLGAIAKLLGQNAGAIDDHCRDLGVTIEAIRADPRAVVDSIAERMNALEAAFQ